MKHASLFSGIGGFDLAAEWMGWETLMQCEIEAFCQKILKYYWPNATLYEDIRTTDFKSWRGRVDILSGGFPCQPYSNAGKRLGKEDNRHLWPEMLRAIREISPRWVVGENVRGFIDWNGGLVFDEVQADLEAEGYETLPFLLPSVSVNTDDERYRCWIIAHSKQNAGRLSIQSKNNAIKTLRQWGQKIRSEDRKQFTVASDSIKTLEEWSHRPAVPEFYDGLSPGLDIKAYFKSANNGYGNAINPRVAYQIFKAIEAYETQQIHQHPEAKL